MSHSCDIPRVPPPPTEVEIRKQLEEILDQLSKSYTWVTGEVEFELRSGERIKGRLHSLEPASAIIDGPRGMEAVLIEGIVNVSVGMASPGPE